MRTHLFWMEFRKIFAFIDDLLIVYGAKMFISRRFIACLNYSMRWLFYIVSINEIGMIVHFRNNWSFMQFIRQLSINGFPLIAQLMLTFKTPQIRRLAVTLISQLAPEHQQRIFKYSVGSLIAYILFTVYVMYSIFSMYISVGDPRDVLLWPTAKVFWYHQLAAYVEQFFFSLSSKQWLGVMATLYCLVLHSWSLSCQRLSAAAMTVRQLDQAKCQTLIKQKQRLNNLKTEFNEHFSWLPFLFFTSLFTDAAGIIMHLRVEGIDYNNSMRLIAFTVNLIATVITLTVAIKANTTNERVDRKYLQEAWFQLDGVDDIKLLAAFKDAFSEKIPLSAILFNLDQSIALGFMSSLISFTIMFLQF
ncbi:hypothetical protein HDE_08955 [Halotydeus destructor]|nr:hypothetical protein HDE_08955 [Halotydeus destructor]